MMGVDRRAILVFAIALYAQIGYGLLIYTQWGHTFFTADAVTLTYNARLLWEGWHTLGGVWLPFFTILLAPLTLVPVLYTSGLAGLIVNSVATGLTAMLLYKLLPNRYGVVVALLFAVNPLTLSLSNVPEQQATAVLFGVGAVYYFKEYLTTDKRSAFVKMATVLTIGAFTRYEIWVVAILLTSGFVVREIKHRRFHSLAFVHLPFWGIFLWLFWELAVFRDPLFFVHTSAGALGGLRGVSSSVPGLLGATLSIVTRVDVLYLMAAVGLALMLLPRRGKFLVWGIVAMFAFSLPIQASVYGLSLPAEASVYGNSPFDCPPYDCPVVDQPTLLHPQLCCPPHGYSIVVIDRAAWQQVGRMVDGPVLITTRVAMVGGDLLSILGHVDPALIIDENDRNFAEVSRAPWRYVDYVVISKEGAEAIRLRHAQFGAHFNYLYYADTNWRAQFEERFQPVFEIYRFTVYERVQSAT